MDFVVIDQWFVILGLRCSFGGQRRWAYGLWWMVYEFEFLVFAVGFKVYGLGFGVQGLGKPSV